MMDLEISSVSSQMLDTLLDGRESVRFHDIRTCSLPSFVKAWFLLGVEAWYAPLYAARSGQNRFDFDDREIRTLTERLDQALKETARFSREECTKIIESALRHEMSYVYGPVNAISGLLFQRMDVLDGQHVADFLTQFHRESYYIDALHAYVSQTTDSRIDQDILEQFLENAKREAYERDPAGALQADVNAIIEVLRLMERDGGADQISLNTWDSFFHLRHLYDSVPRLADVVEAQRRSRQAASLDDLCAALTGQPEPDEPADEAPFDLDAAVTFPADAAEETLEGAEEPAEETTDAEEAADEAPFDLDAAVTFPADAAEETLEGAEETTEETTDAEEAADEAPFDLDEVTFPADAAEETLEGAEETTEETTDAEEPADEAPFDLDEVTFPADAAEEVDELDVEEEITGVTGMSEGPDFPEEPLEDKSFASTFAPPEGDEGDRESGRPVETPSSDGEGPETPDEEAVADTVVSAFIESPDDTFVDNTASFGAQPSDNVASIPPPEITDKLERTFIRKLFNKDAEAYHAVLEQLERAVSWEESFSIIEELWQERGMNLFSKESQEFTRIFYERYYPPG